MNTTPDSPSDENPYQIIGDWHILRGTILYHATHSHGIELILSSHVSLRIRNEEAKKKGLLPKQLATLISQGVDLPWVEFYAVNIESMVPGWVDTKTSGGPLSMQKKTSPSGTQTGSSATSAKPSVSPAEEEFELPRQSGNQSGYEKGGDKGLSK